MTVGDTFEQIASARARREDLRSLPGKDALLLAFYSDVGVVQQTTALNVHGSGTVPGMSLSGSGQPIQLDIRIASVSGGTALGQATYQLALNGGAYGAAVTTATGPTAIGSTGWSINMAGGTYATDQTWQAAVRAVANYAASNVTEPQVGGPGLGVLGNATYAVNARAGLPGFVLDATSAVGGSVIGSSSCSALTATPDAPYTAIWACRYTPTAGGIWSMGGGLDGSVLHYGMGGGTLSYTRRSLATSPQVLALWSNDSAWHVHASRYTGTQIEHWVDGVKVLALTTIASTGTRDMSSAALLQVGKGYDFTPNNGQYQAFAVWKRFLTDYELAVCTRAIQKRFRFIDYVAPAVFDATFNASFQ